MKYFHNYLYGPRCQIFTDHRSFLGLFKEDKSISLLIVPLLLVNQYNITTTTMRFWFPRFSASDAEFPILPERGLRPPCFIEWGGSSMLLTPPVFGMSIS